MRQYEVLGGAFIWAWDSKQKKKVLRIGSWDSS
jgi:hypothetical protein